MTTTRARKSVGDLRERIRERGLRATAPRIAVLQALARLDRPATHADLAADLAGDGWDRATVYRNLVDLTEAGFVRRVDMGDHLWRFELIDERAEHQGAEHPHFLCSSCGEIECLPRDAVRLTTTARAPRSLKKKDVQIQIKGRCDRCAA
jgi:Fur family transcriptional regulator, ferric uptake regulator